MTELSPEERQRLEERCTLLAETAHELRTPLAVILGHAELMAEGGLPEEHTARSAQAIVQAAETINMALQRRLEELRGQLGDPEA